MHFHGDLMITDPGYVAKDAEDWKRCDYGDHMEKLGFTTVLSALVTEGEEDLGCRESRHRGLLRHFCHGLRGGGGVPAGGILRYDPSFDEHLACPENVLWIRDFDGEVTVCGQGEDQWLEGAGTHPFTTQTEM